MGVQAAWTKRKCPRTPKHQCESIYAQLNAAELSFEYVRWRCIQFALLATATDIGQRLFCSMHHWLLLFQWGTNDNSLWYILGSMTSSAQQVQAVHIKLKTHCLLASSEHEQQHRFHIMWSNFSRSFTQCIRHGGHKINSNKSLQARKLETNSEHLNNLSLLPHAQHNCL